MKIFITVTLTLLLLVPELLAGNLGLSLALPVYGAVCIYVAFGASYGIYAAGFAALTVDIIYDRPLPVWSVAAILILLCGASAARRMQRKTPSASLTAGAVCGVLIAFYNIFISIFTSGTLAGPDPYSLLVFHIIGGMFFMFLFVLIFDALNLRSDLPRFGVYDSRGMMRGDG